MSTPRDDFEEINIGGSIPYEPKDHSQGSAQDDTAQGGLLGPRHANLGSTFGPGATDQEILDAILQLSPEQLIPWETCQIPSGGLYYDWPSPAVEVRAMGLASEKHLSNQRLAQSGQSIDYLFRECVRFPAEFDPMDLLVGDRMFLIYYIRGITHGNIYEFAITCPNPQCERASTHVYDMNNLAGTIKTANPALGQEPFKVSLPYMSECIGRNFWVGLRFLRGRDTNSMLAMRRTKKRAVASQAVRVGKEARNPFAQQRETPVDDTLTENLHMVISSVMGDTNRSKIAMFVETMHATDTAAIREWLRDNAPGIDSMVKLNCPECTQEFTVELPITESFFRPTQKRGI